MSRDISRFVTTPGGIDVGKRVSIRVVSADGSTRDLVGTLTSPTRIKRRDGSEVDFDPSTIAHWRLVAATAAKAGTGAPLSLRVREIEAAAADTWPAEASVMSGGWLLRASNGVTLRANSALPLGTPPYGDPNGDVGRAVVEVEHFARSHGIRPALQVALPTYSLLDGYLADAGWELAGSGHVLVHDTRDICMGEPPAFRRQWKIRNESEPSDAWSSVQGRDAASMIMSRCAANYLSIWDDGAAVGAGRLAFSSGWGLITRVFVNDASRGRGVGVAIMEALAHTALASGIERLAVQVSVENRAALALYARLGFRHHHRYRHRVHGAHVAHMSHVAHMAHTAQGG
jgi:GNAT superfamily N-acetyltransferase